jgi:hypothetical protein
MANIVQRMRLHEIAARFSACVVAGDTYIKLFQNVVITLRALFPKYSDFLPHRILFGTWFREGLIRQGSTIAGSHCHYTRLKNKVWPARNEGKQRAKKNAIGIGSTSYPSSSQNRDNDQSFETPCRNLQIMSSPSSSGSTSFASCTPTVSTSANLSSEFDEIWLHLTSYGWTQVRNVFSRPNPYHDGLQVSIH